MVDEVSGADGTSRRTRVLVALAVLLLAIDWACARPAGKPEQGPGVSLLRDHGGP